MPPTQPNIAQEWQSFSDDRRRFLLARMSPEQKKNLRTALEAGQPAAPKDTESRFKPGELRAAPTGATPWLEDVERDVRGGGGRTIVGRALGQLQGRGEKGYGGLEAGTSKGAAEFIGSAPLGLVHAAQGIAETPEHPISGALKTAGGFAEAFTIPAAFMGGPVAGRAIEAIPSAEHAGHLLASVAEDAGHLPVNLNRSADAILRVRDLSERGGTMPQAIRKLLARATEPGGKPLTFNEMRDFYSNITSLTAKEKMGLNPAMRRQLGITAAALKQDIGAAAAQAGRAADYFKGMQEYAQAKKLQRSASEIGKWLIRAGGVGATAELAKLVWNAAPKAPAGIRP